MSIRNRDLNQSIKSNNFGVEEMDQNRVENKKISKLCHVFVMAISWPMDLQIRLFQLGMKIRTHNYTCLEETVNQKYSYRRKEFYETARYRYI